MSPPLPTSSQLSFFALAILLLYRRNNIVHRYIISISEAGFCSVAFGIIPHYCPALCWRSYCSIYWRS